MPNNQRNKGVKKMDVNAPVHTGQRPIYTASQRFQNINGEVVAYKVGDERNHYKEYGDKTVHGCGSYTPHFGVCPEGEDGRTCVEIGFM